VVAQPVGPTLIIEDTKSCNDLYRHSSECNIQCRQWWCSCSDDYTVSIDGAAAVAYTPGTSVGGSATTSIVIQGRRAGCTSGAGCNGTSYVHTCIMECSSTNL
jgi:hypothetical protein